MDDGGGALGLAVNPSSSGNPSRKLEFLDGPRSFLKRFLVENGSFLHHVFTFYAESEGLLHQFGVSKFKHLGKRWCLSPLSFLNLSYSKLKQHEAITIYVLLTSDVSFWIFFVLTKKDLFGVFDGLALT